MRFWVFLCVLFMAIKASAERDVSAFRVEETGHMVAVCAALFDENIASAQRLISRYRETAGRLIFDRRSRVWREHKPTVDYLGDVLRQMRLDPALGVLYGRIDRALDDYFWAEVQ